ncbi:hypothetical protein D3C84_793480 [compost metagenome]
MKKSILIIITAILVLSGGYYYYYMQSEKKMLKDFAYDTINHSIKTNDIVDKYLECDKLGKEMGILFLDHYRKGYYKNPSHDLIKIYSYDEAIKLNKEIGKVSDDYNYDKVFFIYLNNKIKMPILLNDDSKIIAISFALDKGWDIDYFWRLDGKR